MTEGSAAPADEDGPWLPEDVGSPEVAEDCSPLIEPEGSPWPDEVGAGSPVGAAEPEGSAEGVADWLSCCEEPPGTTTPPEVEDSAADPEAPGAPVG